MKRQHYLSAQEAAKLLGVAPATLYAYVSRGLIRSELIESHQRARRYHNEDVQKLLDRKTQRKNPTEVARTALHWGTPILESALTLITEGGLYYRGQDVLKLATSQSVEEIAALLWCGETGQARRLFTPRPDVERTLINLRRLEGDLTPLHKMQVALILASEEDLAAYNTEAEQVRQSGVRILYLLTSVLADGLPAGETIAQTLARTWCPKDAKAARLLSAALILSADHELNVSSFVARVVASAQGQPYLVVTAGLAALQGLRHGGLTEQTEMLLHEAGTPKNSRRVIAERLRRGEHVPGFGHPLYPEGDPRAELLLRLLNDAYLKSPELVLVKAVIAQMKEVLDLAPTIDFMLAALAQVLHLPTGSALSIFALGRTIGWIGHALEQYADGNLIRPRASYVGIAPHLPEEAI